MGKFVWVLVIAVVTTIVLAVLVLLLSAGLDLMDTIQRQARMTP